MLKSYDKYYKYNMELLTVRQTRKAKREAGQEAKQEARSVE